MKLRKSFFKSVGMLLMYLFFNVTITFAQPKFHLKLLTFNCRYLRPTFDIGVKNTTPPESICARIIESDADIVCLNEVFFDKKRKIIIRELYQKGPYKYCVTLVDRIIDGDDSGLMLFSKHQFVDFSPKLYLKCIPMTGIYIPDPTINFKGHNGYPFDIGPWHCNIINFFGAGWDRLAAKSIALVKVKIENPGGLDKFVWIAFTHMQANDEPRIRAGQLEDIQYLIQKTVGYAVNVDEVYIMGDFNIDGNLHGKEHSYFQGKKEWVYHFANQTSFFNNTVWDCWAYETIKSDVGQTADGHCPYFTGPADGKRLDYILRNNIKVYDKSLTVQHIHRFYKLDDLSDHRAVMADINLMAKHNNPKSPAIVPKIIPPQKIWDDNSHKIDFGGRVVWYKIDDSGGFYINVSTPGSYPSQAKLTFEVYQSDDLGLPLNTWDGVYDPDKGYIYQLFQPPYYLKVYSRDRNYANFTDTYQFRIEKLDGTSIKSAIPLPPGYEHDQSYPNPLYNHHTYYFQFYALTPKNPKEGYEFPKLHAGVKKMGTVDYTIEFIDENGNTTHYGRGLEEVHPEIFHNGRYDQIVSADNLAKVKVYIKVTPKNTPTNEKFKFLWQTTYTKVQCLSCKNLKQTDISGGDDEYCYRIWTDDPTLDNEGNTGDPVHDEPKIHYEINLNDYGYVVKPGSMGDVDGGDEIKLNDNSDGCYIAPIEFNYNWRWRFVEADGPSKNKHDGFTWYYWFNDESRGLVVPYEWTEEKMKNWKLVHPYPPKKEKGAIEIRWRYTHQTKFKYKD